MQYSMEETSAHPAARVLGRLKPFDQLKPQQLELLASTLSIFRAEKKAIIIKRGNANNLDLYLLKGRISLNPPDGKIVEIHGDSPQAYLPIAQLKPRRYEVVALSRVEFLLIDSDLCSSLLERDRADNFSSVELDPSGGNMVAKLLDDLQHNRLKLPSLPDVAVRIGKAMHDKSSNADTVADIVQRDPVITAKLIRAANSPLYGGVRPIDSCSEAINRLGFETTYRLALTFALRDLFYTKSAPLRKYMQTLWRHSVRVSAVCYLLSRVTGIVNPEQALLAGLLHDIGEIAIISRASKNPYLADNEKILGRVLAKCRGQVGGALLRRWGFDDGLVLAAEEAENWLRQGAPEVDYADMVILSQLHCFIGLEQPPELPRIDQTPAFNKLDGGKLTPHLSLKILDEAKDKISQTEALLLA